MGILKKLLESWKKVDWRAKAVVILSIVLVAQVVVGGLALRAEREAANARNGGAPAEAMSSAGPRTVAYSEFHQLYTSGRIKEATISYNRIEAVDKDGKKIVLNHDRWLYSANFPRELAEAGVEVKFPDPNENALANFFGTFISVVIPLLMVVMFAGIGFIFWMQARHVFSTSWPNKTPGSAVRFADVAGQEETKFELEEIKTFLKNPSAYERVGAKPPRGVLLVGPPGTGKTLLAKALAGEAGAKFISVSGSDFSQMFVGAGRNRVEKLFREARKNAPCIVFIDEIDSLGRRRGDSSSDVSREQDTTLNQLLVEMDGFETKDGIIVVGATNRVDVLDPAVLRPGRFDRHVHVGLPTLSGRKDILQVHVKGRPIAADVDLEVISRGTPGFSGADLENLVNEAAILAARAEASEITAANFEEARDKVIMGLQRRSLALDEEEKKLIAVHESGHALLACMLPASDPVHQATIIPRGRSLGLVMRLPMRDRVTVRRAKLEADLTVLMGGRAAEELVLGKENVTNGAEADIEQATSMARDMVTRWGLSDKVGMVRLIRPEGAAQDPAVETEIRRIIEDSYARAKELLEANRTGLDALTKALLERETLDGDEVRRIVAGARASMGTTATVGMT